MSNFGFMGKTISVLGPAEKETQTLNLSEGNEIKTETQFEKEIKDKVNIIILNSKNENFAEEEIGNVKLFGKKLVDYVANACIVTPKVLSCEFFHDVLSEIKPYLDSSEWTLVLYADTPLLKKNTILEILEYVYYNGVNVCKFTRGYCFKTEYIKRVKEIYSAQNYSFSEEDFLTVVDLASLSLVREVMKNRICSFHLKNGVDIVSPETVCIDSDVIIERGSVIESNVTLAKGTEISKNCYIGNGSFISNSKIEEDNKIFGAVIDESVIGEHCEIQNFAVVRCSKLDKNCKIYEGAEVLNSKIGKNVKIEALALVSFANMGDECEIGEAVLISKNKGFRTKLFRKVKIGAGAKLLGGISIGDKVEIEPLQLVTKNINAKE